MFGNKRKYNDKILQKVTKWATKIVYTSLIEQIARGAKCYFPDLYETDVLWTLWMASWRHVAACAMGPWALKIDVRKRGPWALKIDVRNGCHGLSSKLTPATMAMGS